MQRAVNFVETSTNRVFIRPEDNATLQIATKSFLVGKIANNAAHVISIAHGIKQLYGGYFRVVNAWQNIASVDVPGAEGISYGFRTVQLTAWITARNLVVNVPAGLLVAAGQFDDGQLYIEVEFAKEPTETNVRPSIQDQASLPFIGFIPGTLENPILINEDPGIINIPLTIDIDDDGIGYEGDVVPQNFDGGSVGFCEFGGDGKMKVVLTYINEPSLGISANVSIRAAVRFKRAGAPDTDYVYRYFWVKMVPIA